MGQAVAGQADAEFGAEFVLFVQFAAHYRSHVGLSDTDNAMVATLRLDPVPVPLLLVQMLDHPVAMQQPAWQW